MDEHPRAREGILRDAAAPRGRDCRRFPFAESLPLLSLLGSDAHSHVFPDRHLGPRAAHLRGRQIRVVHDGRLDPDAGRHSLAIQRHGDIRPANHPADAARRAAGAEPARGDSALPCLFCCVRHQGAALPFPHVAARRARRSADGRLRDSGGRSAENGHLRHDPVLPAALSGCFAPLRAGDCRARHHRNHLRRPRCARPAELEETRCIFFGEPPRLRRPRHFRAPEHLHAGSGFPNARPRHFDRSALPAGGHALRPTAHV